MESRRLYTALLLFNFIAALAYDGDRVQTSLEPDERNAGRNDFFQELRVVPSPEVTGGVANGRPRLALPLTVHTIEQKSSGVKC